MNKASRLIALVLFVSWAGLSPAAAQPADCEPQDPTTAEVNSREGVRIAKAGRFEDAIPLFRMAVRLDACAPEHPLLLARALARAGQREKAIGLYEGVISRFPSTPEAARAERELEALRNAPEPVAQVEPPKEKAPPPEATPPPREEPKRPVEPGPPWRTIGYATAGAGALLLVGGAYFALDAQGADDDLQTAAREPDRARYDDLVDTRDGSGTLAWVFYGTGFAAVGAGIYLAFFMEPGGSAEGTTRVTVAPGQLGWSGTF